MSFLVDTCALSELVRPRPEPRVVAWFESVPPESLFVSVLTFGEIRRGLEKLPPGPRRDRISAWLDAELPAWFEDRVLPIDRPVADEWGLLTAPTKPRALPAVDALIAATARRHRLSMVTRNVGDFAASGVPVVNPWQDG